MSFHTTSCGCSATCFLCIDKAWEPLVIISLFTHLVPIHIFCRIASDNNVNSIINKIAILILVISNFKRSSHNHIDTITSCRNLYCIFLCLLKVLIGYIGKLHPFQLP